MHFLGDHHASQDVVQEAMLRAWKNRKRLRRQSSTKTWLLRITANLCRDRIRRQKHPISQSSQFDEFTGSPRTTLHQDSPLNEVIERESLVTIRSAMSNLPPDYCTVLHLYSVETLSIAEIAKVLNEREGTIRVRLSRARQKLREALKELGILEVDHS